jgi:very-short-patch-repair endonuclease
MIAIRSRRGAPGIDPFKFCDICGDEIYASSPTFRTCWKCQTTPVSLRTWTTENPESGAAEPVCSFLNFERLRRVVYARQWLLRHCESPIEAILGAWLITLMKEQVWPPYRAHMCVWRDAPARRATEMLLIPQFRWMRYRIDLTLRVPTTPRRIVFIECDGEEFHYATEQQIARDKGRQQEMMDARYPVFRFSGSQISRDPEACARSVLDPEFSHLRAEARRP